MAAAERGARAADGAALKQAAEATPTSWPPAAKEGGSRRKGGSGKKPVGKALQQKVEAEAARLERSKAKVRKSEASRSADNRARAGLCNHVAYRVGAAPD